MVVGPRKNLIVTKTVIKMWRILLKMFAGKQCVSIVVSW